MSISIRCQQKFLTVSVSMLQSTDLRKLLSVVIPRKVTITYDFSLLHFLSQSRRVVHECVKFIWKVRRLFQIFKFHKIM